jgi:hypothetical protein
LDGRGSGTTFSLIFASAVEESIASILSRTEARD